MYLLYLAVQSQQVRPARVTDCFCSIKRPHLAPQTESWNWSRREIEVIWSKYSEHNTLHPLVLWPSSSHFSSYLLLLLDYKIDDGPLAIPQLSLYHSTCQWMPNSTNLTSHSLTHHWEIFVGGEFTCTDSKGWIIGGQPTKLIRKKKVLPLASTYLGACFVYGKGIFRVRLCTMQWRDWLLGQWKLINHRQLSSLYKTESDESKALVCINW